MQTEKQKGFTLVELLTTLIILSVLVALAVPNFVTWIKNNRIDAATRNLTGAFQLARSEAVSRQTVITVNSGGDWTNGLTIYTDTNPAGNTDYTAADDSLIKDLTYSMDGITLAGNDDNNFISFTSTGLLNEGPGNQRLIAICDDRGADEGTLITLSTIGRATIGNAINCAP